MILLLFTGMTFKAWKNYTNHFLPEYENDENLKAKLLKDDNAFEINLLDVDNESQSLEDEDKDGNEEYSSSEPEDNDSNK